MSTLDFAFGGKNSLEITKTFILSRRRIGKAAINGNRSPGSGRLPRHEKQNRIGNMPGGYFRFQQISVTVVFLQARFIQTARAHPVGADFGP